MVSANSPQPTAVYDMAAGLLEAACTELDLFKAQDLGFASYPGCPPRKCVVPGRELTWDDCDCGLLGVNIVTAYPSENFPFQLGGNGPSTSCSVPWLVVHYAVTILRCTPTMGDDGKPPPCDALAAAARIDFADRTAIWRGVACYLATPVNSGGVVRPHLLQEQLSIGEQGACSGSELHVLVGLNLCVPCG
jgi:hypothetical protein